MYIKTRVKPRVKKIYVPRRSAIFVGWQTRQNLHQMYGKISSNLRKVDILQFRWIKAAYGVYRSNLRNNFSLRNPQIKIFIFRNLPVKQIRHLRENLEAYAFVWKTKNTIFRFSVNLLYANLIGYIFC